jgi:hypothetical protein
MSQVKRKEMLLARAENKEKRAGIGNSASLLKASADKFRRRAAKIKV